DPRDGRNDMHSLTVSLSDGERLLDALLKNGAAIAHDCGGTLACASCCVIVRDGLDTLTAPSADEVDMLDRACVAEPGARLACQAVGSGEIVVEIPRAEAPSHEKILPVVATPRAARASATAWTRSAVSAKTTRSSKVAACASWSTSRACRASRARPWTWCRKGSPGGCGESFGT